MEGEREYFFTCPYCFSQISFVLETYNGEQSYIEDCEVCCRSIEITYRVDDGEVTDFNCKSEND